MTSMPASRSARAITFAPRSCPSRPGFAMTTRILRIREHLRDLRDKGIELIDEVPRPGAHGDVAFLQPASALGVLVELLQPTVVPASGS